MLSEKITSVNLALADLAGEVAPEHWEMIRACRQVLAGVAESAENLEHGLVPLAPPVKSAVIAQ